MINLAGDKRCDEVIKDELERAQIEVVSKPVASSGEVAASLEGVIRSPFGELKLKRAWSYWVVNGDVPLEIAKKLYAHPEGQRSVRVAGHCMCPPPEEWLKFLDEQGRELITPKDDEEYRRIMKDKVAADYDKTHRVSDNFERDGKGYIDLYHIDTQAGLLLFSLMVNGKL